MGDVGQEMDQYRRYMESKDLDYLATAYANLSMMIRAAEEQRKILVPILLARMKENGLQTIERKDYRIRILKSKTSRIVDRLLLEQGVSPDVIRRATVTTEYETVALYPSKGRDGGA